MLSDEHRTRARSALSDTMRKLLEIEARQTFDADQAAEKQELLRRYESALLNTIRVLWSFEPRLLLELENALKALANYAAVDPVNPPAWFKRSHASKIEAVELARAEMPMVVVQERQALELALVQMEQCQGLLPDDEELENAIAAVRNVVDPVQEALI